MEEKENEKTINSEYAVLGPLEEKEFPYYNIPTNIKDLKEKEKAIGQDIKARIKAINARTGKDLLLDDILHRLIEIEYMVKYYIEKYNNENKEEEKENEKTY